MIRGLAMGNLLSVDVLDVDREGEGESPTLFEQRDHEPSHKIVCGYRCCLDETPQYIGSPGKLGFDERSGGDQLYLHFPGGRDLNTTRIEVARNTGAIASRCMNYAHTWGLASRFTNACWILMAVPHWVSHESIEVESRCVHLLASSRDTLVNHRAFGKLPVISRPARLCRSANPRNSNSLPFDWMDRWGGGTGFHRAMAQAWRSRLFAAKRHLRPIS